MEVDPWKADQVMSNKVRVELIQELLKAGELHISDLERRVGKPWGTVAYHLGMLENAKIVHSEYRLGKHHSKAPVKRYYRVDRRKLADYLGAWEKLPADIRLRARKPVKT